MIKRHHPITIPYNFGFAYFRSCRSFPLHCSDWHFVGSFPPLLIGRSATSQVLFTDPTSCRPSDYLVFQHLFTYCFRRIYRTSAVPPAHFFVTLERVLDPGWIWNILPYRHPRCCLRPRSRYRLHRSSISWLNSRPRAILCLRLVFRLPFQAQS